MTKNTDLQMSFKTSNQAIWSFFLDAIKVTDYHHLWLTSEAWIDILHDKYNIDKNTTYTINVRNFNQAISKHPILGPSMDDLSTPNTTGVFRSFFFRQRDNGKGCKKITAYYITKSGSVPRSKPGGTTKWYNSFSSKAPQKLVGVDTRQQPAAKRNLTALQEECRIGTEKRKSRKLLHPPSSRITTRSRGSSCLVTQDSEKIVESDSRKSPPLTTGMSPSLPQATSNTAAQAIANQSYWDSLKH